MFGSLRVMWFEMCLFKFFLLFRILATCTTWLISTVFVLRSAAVPNGEIGRLVMSKTEMSSPVYPGCLIGLLMDGFFLRMSVKKFEPFSEKSHPPTNTSVFICQIAAVSKKFRANPFKTF